MPINPFKLERYFAQYEFKTKYLLSSSDCESLSLTELLQMASPENLELWQGLKLGYTESSGHPLLRKEVSRLYARINPDQVVIAAPQEAIYIAMQTLLSPGDHVIAISPAYQSLYEVARSIGCRLTPWKLEAGPDGWTLDLEHLERSITDRTRLVVLNFPHNPTGHLLLRNEFEAILSLARKHDLILFSDEMYRLLEYKPDLRLPAVCDVYEKGISLSGLSKSMALPGLRIGWLATQANAWLTQWQSFKDYLTICSSAPSEILGIIALQNKEHIVTRNLEIINGNLAVAERFFSKNSARFTWFRPQAGSVAFPCWLGEGTVEQFCQQVLDRRGVLLVPGSLFEYPGNHFRIGLGRRSFSDAIERVEEYLRGV